LTETWKTGGAAVKAAVKGDLLSTQKNATNQAKP
jgi:hypothetical protein